MNSQVKLKIFENKYIEISIVVLLLVIIFALRINHLDADPPNDLSISSDVFTDPAQYTLFAKHLILSGELNPFDDNRFLFFIKSSVTALAILLFQLLGVSLFTSNLTGLIYSFGSLFFFYLIVRKSGGITAAIIYLLMISVNYNQIFYGRLPFLEHAMTFYAFLSIVILMYFPDNKGYLLSGILLAIGIFFGKIIGVVFLVPFGIYILHKSLGSDKITYIKRIGLFTGGVVGLALIWYYFFYFPMQEQVASYVEEKAFSLYGFPLAFQSFDNFIWKYVSFGDDSKLFLRMAIPAILGTFFIGSILVKSSDSVEKKRADSSQLLVISMIITFYLFLMVWNYRPLRYQLVLIYPFYGAAGIILANLLKHSENKEKIKSWKIILLFPLVYPVIYQLFDAYIVFSRGEFFYSEYRWTVIVISIFVAGIIFALKYLINSGYITPASYFKKILVITLIGLILIPGIEDYYDWANRISYKIRDNSIDLGSILSNNAIVSGPYAATLTLNNNKSSIIHMFGVSESNPDFFKEKPITHLLLDYSNEKRAKTDYPVIMNSANMIMTYYIGLKPVKLYRIAGFTENESANKYHLSGFELMMETFKNNKSKIDTSFANRFIKRNPDNISVYLLLAEEAERDNVLTITEKMYKKAVEFSPTNYNLNARMGKFYKERFDLTGIDWYKQEGLRYYENAIRYAPTVFKFKRSWRELNNTQINRDTN
jgi:hypothetical protein